MVLVLPVPGGPKSKRCGKEALVLVVIAESVAMTCGCDAIWPNVFGRLPEDERYQKYYFSTHGKSCRWLFPIIARCYVYYWIYSLISYYT